MDHHLLPPIAALQNLTITDSLSTPTTAPMLSQEDDLAPRRVYLNQLLRRLYASSSRSSILQDPRPSCNLSALKRMKEGRSQASQRVACHESFNGLRKQISRLLKDMAKRKPEHREKLLLANIYIQQRKNKEEVLRIIKSY